MDGATLTTLAHLRRGEIDDAVSAGRRASRIAATEGIIQREYFANLALARVRRHAGHPASATRILSALSKVVPPPWFGWLDWELALCDMPTPDFDFGSLCCANFSLPPRATLSGKKYKGPLLDPRAYAGFVSEASFVAAASDDSVSASGWLAGLPADMPPALRGLVVPAVSEAGDELAAAFIVTDGNRGCRRILVRALGHAQAVPLELGFTQSGRRTFEALATLAAAEGQSMPVAELFEHVYGFAFLAARHQGTLRTLLYRMRKALGDRADVERQGDVCHLRVHQRIAIPDPHSAPELPEIVLRLLAARGGRLSVAAVAKALSVPRRTIQRALKGLVEIGACELVQEGRNAFYQMEDTTFSDPTLTRLKSLRQRQSQ